MSKQTLKQKTYEALKSKILDCSYPPGSMINEEQIKEAFGISRTPVREALNILESEGLVTIKSKKGVLITPIDFNEVNHIFEVRILIEPYILKNYGPRIPKEQLIDLYQRHLNCKSQDERGTIQLDDDFHHTLISTLDNLYLKNFYQTIREKNTRLRILTGESNERLSDTINEHIKILKYCMQQNWENASESMLIHLKAAKQSVFDLFFEDERFISKFSSN